jgi:hypothetical protein
LPRQKKATWIRIVIKALKQSKVAQRRPSWTVGVRVKAARNKVAQRRDSQPGSISRIAGAAANQAPSRGLLTWPKISGAGSPGEQHPRRLLRGFIFGATSTREKTSRLPISSNSTILEDAYKKRMHTCFKKG